MEYFFQLIFFLFATIIFIISAFVLPRKNRESEWSRQRRVFRETIKANNLDTSNAKKVHILNTQRDYCMWLVNDELYLLCDPTEVRYTRKIPTDLIRIKKQDIKYYFRDGQLLSEVVGTGSTLQSSLFFSGLVYSKAGTISTNIKDTRSCRLFFTVDGKDKIIEFANDDFYTFKELIPEKDYEIYIANQKDELKSVKKEIEKPAISEKPTNDIKVKLTQLKELKESGLITEEEFAAKKEQLLNSIIG